MVFDPFAQAVWEPPPASGDQNALFKSQEPLGPPLGMSQYWLGPPSPRTARGISERLHKKERRISRLRTCIETIGVRLHERLQRGLRGPGDPGTPGTLADLVNETGFEGIARGVDTDPDTKGTPH